jgi:translation initiation factor 2-alpha kinase 4
VKGLSTSEQNILLQQIQAKAQELAQSGTVMVIELVQLVEDYLIEHNEDPTVSAWEQMRAREKEQEAKQRALERQWMDNTTSEQLSRPNDHEGTSNNKEEGTSDTIRMMPARTADLAPDIARELARQRQAIAAATQRRQLSERVSSTGEAAPTTNPLGEILEDDDDEDDFDDYEAPPPPIDGSNSRYRTDFIELGVLGRGGGGEVVKVRNRLDRRICKFRVLDRTMLGGLRTRTEHSFFLYWHDRCHQKDHFGVGTREICQVWSDSKSKAAS